MPGVGSFYRTTLLSFSHKNLCLGFTLFLFSVYDIDADNFVSLLLMYDSDLLVDDFPHQLSDEYISLNLQSKRNVVIDDRVQNELAEILVERDRTHVNEILEDDLVVGRLGQICDEDEECLTTKILVSMISVMKFVNILGKIQVIFVA